MVFVRGLVILIFLQASNSLPGTSFFQIDLDNDEVGMSPALAPTKKEAKKEDTSEPTPAKGAGNGKPASAAAAKGKRKATPAGEEAKANINKKAKVDPDKVGDYFYGISQIL